MYDQRMQLLLSKAQRARLDRESRATGRSISALVREAIDTHYQVEADRNRRLAAARALTDGRRKVEHIPPAELKELIASRFDDEMDKIERQRRQR